MDGNGVCMFLSHQVTLHLDLLVSNGIVEFFNITIGALVILVLKRPSDSHVKSLSFLYRSFFTHAEVKVAFLPVRVALGPGEVVVDGRLMED